MTRLTTTLLWLSTSCLALSAPAFAQVSGPAITGTQTAAGTNRPLQLDNDSPFRDPNIIYLEADELINDEPGQTLTAQGSVQGRYQDRTLRADSVIYNLASGQVIASGNVVLIDATGATQYADKLELSDKLEAGTASNFTSRFAGGGLTAARFVVRNSDEEVELYNAYYTACEVCKNSEGQNKTPSWRIKARRVKQDADTRTIRYNDAVFEFMGVPVFYTPYLAHPDPSQDRASGLLAPFGGVSRSKGVNVQLPYYWAINDYTEATVTPHLFTGVNPLLEGQFARQFHTGRINIDSSITYGSVFDRRGDAFDDPSRFVDPTLAPLGKGLHGHVFADGVFEPNEDWVYGFTLQYASDDNYLTRYDLDDTPPSRGLIKSQDRRNINQAFLLGTDDNFRLAVSAYGVQDLRDQFFELNGDPNRILVIAPDDDRQPIIAPEIEFDAYFDDPLMGGRFKLFGDAAVLARDSQPLSPGDTPIVDYIRGTIGAEYSKSWIAPGGVEVKPFGMVRLDQYDLEIDSFSPNGTVTRNRDFSRTLGQVGVDIRYPFIKAPTTKNGISWVLEPRAQFTYSFGDAKIGNFYIFDPQFGGFPFRIFQDSGSEDLNTKLLWQPNKATGFDAWQSGVRADFGASLNASWGKNNAVDLFLGQSYVNDSDNGSFVDDPTLPVRGDLSAFTFGEGLSERSSDIVSELDIRLGKTLRSNTRIRVDDRGFDIARLDSNLSLNTKIADFNIRYYQLDNGLSGLRRDDLSPFFERNILPPTEEVSGGVNVRLNRNWSVGYSGFYDIGSDRIRRQSASLAYRDDCTLVELIYTRDNLFNDAIRNTEGFGIRVSLLTLGDFGG